MNFLKRATNWLQVPGCVLALYGLSGGQSLEAKLSRQADLVPKKATAFEQLIEVARYYKIPMGIEWVDQPVPAISASEMSEAKTVQNLITTILSPYPSYRVKAGDEGVLHISDPAFVNDTRNFLNIRIPEFKVDEANVLDAESVLRLEIKMTLHPEQYAGGWNGGYGGRLQDEGLNVRNITFSGHNLSIREILDKIITMNGKASWIVRLNPARMMTTEPTFFSAQDDADDHAFRWQIIPLR